LLKRELCGVEEVEKHFSLSGNLQAKIKEGFKYRAGKILSWNLHHQCIWVKKGV